MLQEVITAARNARAELKLDPKRRVAADIYLSSPSGATLIGHNRNLIERLGVLSELRSAAGRLDPTAGPVRSTAQFELRIPYGETVDVNAELARLRKDRDRLAQDLRSKESRLADQTFRSKAPAEVVRQMEATFAERRVEFEKLSERLAQLESSSGNSANT